MRAPILSLRLRLRSFPLLASILCAALVLAAPARAQIENAPLLVADLDTGRVLFERNAAGLWFPASLTKLMTAYVALDAARQGRLGMSSLLNVSAQAAAMPPSKMGFPPGSQITLQNALKIIMVRSANDVAVTIAENVSGSHEAFVREMNATAARLGLGDTRFANASGLPDASKRTSARDMALLAQALWRDFPNERWLWGMQSIVYGNNVMNNHNGIIGRYPGATGMKTGYICSSGFNVVATAQRGGRNLVAVVLGQMTANERTALTASLLEYGFTAPGWFGGTLADLPRTREAAPPDLRPIVCDPNRPRNQGEDHNDVAAVAVSRVTSGALGFAAGPRLPVVELPARRVAEPVRVHLGLPAGAVAGPAPAAPAAPAATRQAELGSGLPLDILPPARGPLIDLGRPAPAAAAPVSRATSPGRLPPPRPAGL